MANNDVIALKLDQITEKQEHTDRRLSMLTERVLSPESGAFSQLQAVKVISEKNAENIDELYDSADKLLEICKIQEKNLQIIEKWVESHDQRNNQLRDNIEKLANTVKEYTDWTEEKFDQNDKNIKPLQDDFTIRKSNKSWKDKLMWIIITGLITALALPPVIKLFGNGYQEKPKVEIKSK